MRHTILLILISWCLVEAQHIPQLVLPIGHTGVVHSVEFSSDDRYIITSSSDRTAKIWDASSGKLLRTLEGHTDYVFSATFSSDGSLAATASADGTVRVWEVVTGHTLFEIDVAAGEDRQYTADGGEAYFLLERTRLCFSRDNKKIYILRADEQALVYTLLNPLDGKGIGGTKDGVAAFAQDPDGQYIAIADYSYSGKHSIRIRNGNSGKELHRMQPPGINVNDMKFSGDGHYLLSMSSNDEAYWSDDVHFLCLWDVRTGKMLKENSEIDGRIYDAQLRNDGKWLIATPGSGPIISIIDAFTWEVVYNLTLTPGARSHNSARFSLDGSRLFTQSKSDYYGSDIYIWDTYSGKLLNTIELNSAANSIFFSNEEDKLAIGTNSGNVAIMTVDSAEVLNLLHGYTQSLQRAICNPDGERLAMVTDSTVRFLDFRTGRPTHALQGHSSKINDAHFSSDGNQFVYGCEDGSVHNHDVNAEANISFNYDHAGSTIHAEFISDDRFIAYFKGTRGIKILHADNGELFRDLHLWANTFSFSHDGNLLLTADYEVAEIIDWQSDSSLHYLFSELNYISHSCFSPDDSMVVISDEVSAEAFRTDTGEPIFRTNAVLSPQQRKQLEWIREVFQIETNILKEISFSPDGNLFFTTDGLGTIYLWNAKNGKRIRDLAGHTASVREALFSGNGKFLVSASYDGTARLWDVGTGECMHVFKGHSSSLNSVCFIPDTRFIVTTSMDNTAKLWDITTGRLSLTWIPVLSNDWVITAPNGLFDASPGAMHHMYYVAGMEVIALEQLKDRYYQPNLWAKVTGADAEPMRISEGITDAPLLMYPEIRIDQDHGSLIKIQLSDRGGGIGRTMIYINGKEAVQDARELAKETADGRIDIAFDLNDHPYILPGKPNSITIRAYNATGNVVSDEVGTTYIAPSKEGFFKRPSLFLVCAGISDYTGKDIDLKFAAGDARRFSEAVSLGARRLFGTERTFNYVLTTDSSSVREPTKAGLIRAFEEIAEQAGPEDVLVIYLSGHGINLGGPDGDFYYLTRDAYTASSNAYSDPAIRDIATLSSNELVDWIRDIPALKQVLVIDACASGRVVDDLLAQRDISSGTIRALDRLKDRTGMHVITGSAADAVSYEASRYGQGLLTYSLLEGIKGAALRNESFVDVATLFQFARERVPGLAREIGGVQEPFIISPYDAASFDIGELTPEDRELIPLASVKPVFTRCNFMDEDEYEDVLGLSALVDARLSEITSRGRHNFLVFIDARDFPTAYRISGLYRQHTDGLGLTMRIRSDTIDERLELRSEDPAGLIDLIESEIARLLGD